MASRPPTQTILLAATREVVAAAGTIMRHSLTKCVCASGVAVMALTCTPPPLPAKPVYAHPIFDYTVVWGTKSDLAFRQCSRPVPRVAGLYTPTHAQVDSMIVDLTALKPELEKKLSIPLEGYRYQAIGFNAKLIYLNCFAVSRDRGLLDWRSDIVAVCDTGDSYWGIVYDVEHRTFGDFQKNGGRPQ